MTRHAIPQPGPLTHTVCGVSLYAIPTNAGLPVLRVEVVTLGHPAPTCPLCRTALKLPPLAPPPSPESPT